MSIEDNVREAIAGELRRQADAADGALSVTGGESRIIEIHGRVNLDELTMALVGALAGGP